MYIMQNPCHPKGELVDLLLCGTTIGLVSTPSHDPIDQVATSCIGCDEEIPHGLLLLEDFDNLQDIVTIQHTPELTQQKDLLVLITLLLPSLALLELLYRHLLVTESISAKDGGLSEAGIDDSKATSPQEDILVDFV